MTRYIVIASQSEIASLTVTAFDQFDTAYHYLLTHECAQMFEIPSSGIGPCDDLSQGGIVLPRKE